MKLAENFVLQIALNVYVLLDLGLETLLHDEKSRSHDSWSLSVSGKKTLTKYYNYHTVVWTWNICRIGSFRNVGIEL